MFLIKTVGTAYIADMPAMYRRHTSVEDTVNKRSGMLRIFNFPNLSAMFTSLQAVKTGGNFSQSDCPSTDIADVPAGKLTFD